MIVKVPADDLSQGECSCQLFDCREHLVQSLLDASERERLTQCGMAEASEQKIRIHPEDYFCISLKYAP